MENKIKGAGIFNNLIVLYLILSSGGVIFGENESLIVGLFSIVLCGALIINRKLRYNKKCFYFLGILISPVIISAFINFTGESGMINFIFGYILKIINAFLVVSIIPISYFKRIYINQIYILSIISLIFYTIFSFFPTVINIIPSISEDNHYINYGIFVYQKPFYGNILRNTSIFYEPGVFQGIVNLALIFLLDKNRLSTFNSNNSDTKYWIVFILTILTTFSTTGLIALIILLTIKLLQQKVKLFTIGILITSMLPLAFLMFKAEYLENVIINKVSNLENSSTERRYGDIIMELELFKSNPIIGTGYTFFEKKAHSLSKSNVKEQWTGSTNSLTYHLALFGLFFMIPVLYSIFKFSMLSASNFIIGILIFLSLLIILLGETFLQKMLFLCLLFFHIDIPFVKQST